MTLKCNVRSQPRPQGLLHFFKMAGVRIILAIVEEKALGTRGGHGG